METSRKKFADPTQTQKFSIARCWLPVGLIEAQEPPSPVPDSQGLPFERRKAGVFLAPAQRAPKADNREDPSFKGTPPKNDF